MLPLPPVFRSHEFIVDGDAHPSVAIEVRNAIEQRRRIFQAFVATSRSYDYRRGVWSSSLGVRKVLESNDWSELDPVRALEVWNACASPRCAPRRV